MFDSINDKTLLINFFSFLFLGKLIQTTGLNEWKKGKKAKKQYSEFLETLDLNSLNCKLVYIQSYFYFKKLEPSLERLVRRMMKLESRLINELCKRYSR